MAAVLALIMFFIVVGIHLLLRARRNTVAGTVPAKTLLPMAEPVAPPGVFLHPAHAWARLSTDSSIRVGIDTFLAGVIGDIDDVELPPRGAQVKRGERLFRLRAGERMLDVLSPIEGEVIGAHAETESRPWSVAMDPYGVGWVVSMRSAQPKEGLVALKTGPAATAFLREELRRWTDFVSSRTRVGGQPVLADGAMPVRGAAAQLDDADWGEFVRSFVSQAE